MGKAKLISLQKVFWRFLIILISGLFLSVAIPFLLLALASNAGYVTYYNILYTNMDVTNRALKFTKTGENSGLTSRTQYQFIPREEEYCVLKYYVGSQYKSNWMQKYLPAPETLLLMLIGINCIAVCVYLTLRYSQKLKVQNHLSSRNGK